MNVSQEQPRLAIAYPGLLTKAESENKRPYRRTIKSLDGTVYTDKLFKDFKNAKKPSEAQAIIKNHKLTEEQLDQLDNLAVAMLDIEDMHGRPCTSKTGGGCDTCGACYTTGEPATTLHNEDSGTNTISLTTATTAGVIVTVIISLILNYLYNR